MGRMMADGKMAVGGTQKLGKKIKNDFCDLIFITPVVEQVLLDLPTMVLPSDETSKYFISLKNRAKTKRFELWFVSGPRENQEKKVRI